MVRGNSVVSVGAVALAVLTFAFILHPEPLVGQQEDSEPFRIPGLVVTATPVPLSVNALGTHVSVLSGEDLRARGVTRVADALEEVAGISVVRSGSFGSVTSLFLRGGESDYVQIMVDGVQVNQPGGSFDLSGLTTADVERIEIVRGPASALHGSDAVGGVIHIVTRDGTGGSPGSLTVRGGSYGRLDGTAHLSGGSERASYALTLSRTTTDGILEFNNAHENTLLSGKATFRLDDRSRARIAARVGSREFHFPTDFTGALVDENQFTFNDESSLGVELDRRLGERVELRALLTTYRAETGTDDAPDGPADTLGFFGFQSMDNYRRSSADLRANITLHPGAIVTVGGEFEEQRVRAFNESLSEFGASTGRSVNDRTNRAGYLHAVLGSGRVRGNLGARMEDNEAFGGFLSWQGGISYQATAALRLRGAVGRGIKEPTFLETFSQGFVTGNPELDPETSTSWEVGVEQRVVGGLRAQVTWFQQRFQDLIQYTGAPPEPDAPNFFNVAGARSRGLELGLGATISTVSLEGDLTWIDTEVTDAGFDTGSGATFVEGEPLLRRPEWVAGARLGWTPDPSLRLHASARRVGERSDRDFAAFPAEPVTLDPYTLVNAGVQWTAWSSEDGPGALTLLLDVRNLTDESYQEVFSFRTPGRVVTVGGRVVLGS